jgi:murein DD-endopeptidase MepM/ murein hydrolase activator NlpD
MFRVLSRIAIVSLVLLTLWVVNAQDSTPTAVPTPRPRPTPTSILTLSPTVSVERYFGDIAQGNTGLLRLVGDDVNEAQAIFNNETYPFFKSEDDGSWYALIVADIDSQPRGIPLQILASTTDGALLTIDSNVNITSSGFVRQNFTVPADRAFLINPEVERNEFARIDAITSTITPRKLWNAGGFVLPMSSEIVSPFGVYRILNSTVQTRHTGWDQQAAVGTPIYAMASGTIAFSGVLDIRGNYVLIDHGWGIYTGYAHLSQITVAEGQSVTQGQTLGLSGNTGRSSGPHLHWEVAINSEWIDGQQLIGLWLP